MDAPMCETIDQNRRRWLAGALALTITSLMPGEALAASVFSSRRISVTVHGRSEEHTSELQSLMRISYAVFCLKKKTTKKLSNKWCNYVESKHKQQYLSHTYARPTNIYAY